jgi:hypothetical protein
VQDVDITEAFDLLPFPGSPAFAMFGVTPDIVRPASARA